MNNTTNQDYRKLRILQINLGKSKVAQFELLNRNLAKCYDLILIQEPYINPHGFSPTPFSFRPVFPASRNDKAKGLMRSVTWVNTELDTALWKEIRIPSNNDITAVQVSNEFGKITIFNVYNDGSHDRTLHDINSFLTRNRTDICAEETDHMLWCGDFNRHHALWDEDEATHLFTKKAIEDAGVLINIVADWDMVMALEKGPATLIHKVTKKYSRPDNVFCSNATLNLITRCQVLEEEQPPSTDHFPIVTNINLPLKRVIPPTSYNFRATDWNEFLEDLEKRICDPSFPAPETITTPEKFQEIVSALTNVLQETIRTKAKVNKPCPHSKRWWNNSLEDQKKAMRKVCTLVKHFRALPGHAVHGEYRQMRNTYAEQIWKAKVQHWVDFLENVMERDIWTANNYIKEPIGDGGKARIPTLKATDQSGRTQEFTTNEDKAEALARAFFPKKPEVSSVPPCYTYPPPLAPPEPITKDQVRRHISRLSPFKAPGPDGIPNIVLQKAVDHIIEYLVHIYRAILTLEVYYNGWREFTTVVLRKPGKSNYEIPKAYRPIALLNTMAKVLTAIVAEDTTRMVERHHLLPENHFGGRPGRTTTDAVHLLVHKIKDAWRRDKVVSVLFLDVEGAFPNAVTDRVIHNLRKRSIPTAYVNFVKTILEGRTTKLRFDDFISITIAIANGIGQGDPMSMLIYILYNAELLEICRQAKESAIGYVDDGLLVAEGADFKETTRTLVNIMEREDGGFKWSEDHNSNFELSKLAVMHCTQKRRKNQATGRLTTMPRPVMKLRGVIVKEVASYKYLGIHIDQELRWNVQVHEAVAKATKYMLMFRRLTKPATGIGPKLMRRLYTSVAIPKLTYGADIWYTPPHTLPGKTRRSGSVGALKQLERVQRIATLAITGAFRTTPTDLLDAHAGLLPIEHMLSKVCHRALIRLCTLPDTNPMAMVTKEYYDTPTRKHPTSLHVLLQIYQANPNRIETISPVTKKPNQQRCFSVDVADSRLQSIINEKASDPELKIFTDGSGFEGGAGAAAVLFRKGRAQPARILRYHLGPLTEHTSYEAEAVGSLLAVWLLQNETCTGEREIVTYTDSQAFITATGAQNAKPAQYLMSEYLTLTEKIGTRKPGQANRDNPRPNKFNLRWISAHSGVMGNEKVDEEAKKAAQGKSSPTLALPPLLRTPLPSSSTALKQTHLAGLKKKWQEEWKKSPRHAKLTKIDPQFPFDKFRKRQDKLTRAQASMLMQIRTGHIGLNKYLFTIKKARSPKCQLCFECSGREIPETVKHFLFECQGYDNERHVMRMKLGRKSKDLKYILSDEGATELLLKYISRTKRLRLTPGEVQP